MTCQELLAYLSAYIDGELDESVTAQAREHLATCQNCTVVLNTTQRTILLGRGQARHAIPADQRGPLLASLREAFLRQRPG